MHSSADAAIPTVDVSSSRRVVVVTGGAGGIGSATCRLFATRGWAVAILDQPSCAATGNAIAAELNAQNPGSAMFAAVDVGSPSSISSSFASVLAWSGGRLDSLVSMAALFTYGEVHEVPAEAWDAVLGVNVRGSALCCAEAIRAMRVRGHGGAIVLVSSITATMAFPAFVPYSATKAALLQMARDMALDNGRFGIRVNCCAPGPIFTEGGTVAHAAREGRPVEIIAKELSNDVALRRMGTPDECARAIYFLCSEDACVWKELASAGSSWCEGSAWGSKCVGGSRCRQWFMFATSLSSPHSVLPSQRLCDGDYSSCRWRLLSKMRGEGGGALHE